MGFQAPFEIAQSQLSKLRLSSVEAREVVGGIYPFFEAGGATRFLVIETAGGAAPVGDGGLWMVEEFPLEIRLRKAIYPRPIVHYRPFADLEPETLSGLYHFDPRGVLIRQPSLPESFPPALEAGNVASRSRGQESIRDLFFTLDLRRLTGGVSRWGPFLRRRLELAALRSFLESARPRAR